MDEISNRRWRFRAFFNGLSALALLFLFYNGKDALRNPFRQQNPNPNPHRRISEVSFNNSSNLVENGELDAMFCGGITNQEGYSTRCEFLRLNRDCSSGGLFDYIKFFYCSCENFHALGFAILGLWLMALFYLMGNTAADYFCCNLGKLSNLLKLPPTVAGVTLLPFGNGAPDVFASIAAFVGSGAGEVGLNSVLGGAVFVSCVVVGTISLCVAEKNLQIDRRCFVRDIGFFLLTLASLSLILISGEVSFWRAVVFVSIYVVYAFVVVANELLGKHAGMLKLECVTPLLPAKRCIFSYGSEMDEAGYTSPFGDDITSGVPHLPQWMWASNVAIYSNHRLGVSSFEKTVSLWGWNDEGDAVDTSVSSKVLWLMEMPLTLSRRLTIPIVEEERWSKAYAVANAFLSPVLLAFLLGVHNNHSFNARIASYVVGGFVGLVLGTLSFLYTKTSHPPRKFLLLWVLGGFVMSIAWFYIIANELVALLVALGVILRIKPSILGLTVLAWGNSMGDLMSNVALAMNGGDGVQIAMSGCYAGPMFNTLCGLGVSMLLKAWSATPAAYVLPKDSSLIYTMGFLISGLIWSLCILPRNDMRPNRTLGFGLIALYLMFIFIRLCSAVDILSFGGSH